MLNKCLFIGHVGADPELRSTQAGKRIANLRLAVSEKWRDKDGNRQEKTEWVSVVCFAEGLVKVIEQYVKKGSKIYIEGSLATRKWQDQSGQDRYSTEVILQGFNATLVLLDSAGADKPDDRSGGDYGKASGREQPRQKEQEYDSYGNKQPAFSRDMDDDIPF
jgi:single-strand DNA-binding protein